MKHLGKFLPSGQKPNAAGGKVNPIDKARAANYAATKMEWALQVAADSDLSETAYRIALVWPEWLNSKSLLAWPSQSTIAKTIGCGNRAVRSGLKRLEDHGHLICINTYRGGRKTNSYRIVVQDCVISEIDGDPPKNESGTDAPVPSARPFQSDRHQRTSQSGPSEPITAGSACRGTLDRTLKRTRGGGNVPSSAASLEEPTEPRASKEEAAEILRQAFGAQNVNENGHLHRK
jgi:hypothetical protein